MDVYDASLLKVASSLIPACDRSVRDGFFVYGLKLDNTYDVGHYTATISYTANSIFHMEAVYFEVVAGGDDAGAIVSQVFYERPQAKFLVQKLDGGTRRLAKNPRGS